MSFLFAQFLNGLVYGTLLFLTAAGLSLIFGLMNVVSLAHGSFFMLGAFIGFSIFKLTGSFWLALVLAPIPVAALGLAMEVLFMRRLYKRGHLDQVLLTFGFTFVFFDAVTSIWGTDMLSLPLPSLFEGTVSILGAEFPKFRLFLIGFGVVLALGLWIFLDRSRLGAMVRAGVDNAAMAAGLGGNVPVLFASVFSAGVALAGIGGVVAGPVMGVYLGMDLEILIPAFIVIVIGGMGSLRGAFVGSMIIGIADTFGRAYLPGAAMFLIYLVMALMLLVRPEGLFGLKQGPESAAAVPIAPGAAPRSATASGPFGAAALVLMIAFPFLVPEYARTLVAEIYIFAILAMSLDLLLGFTGLMSLGHAAFFGLSAYAVVILAHLFGLNAWLGMLVGIGLSAVGAAVIGVLSVRTSGITFLMLTLAFSQLVYSVAFKWRSLTGGSDGLGVPDKPGFFGFSLQNSYTVYFMTLIFLVACFLALRRLIGSSLGHAFIGIRENEHRMQAIGYPTRAYKLLSFIIGGCFAGIAGGLYAIYNGFISPDAVLWTASGDILIMVMLGGAGSLYGPAIGSGLFLLMKNLVSTYSSHWMLIIGVIFICCVLFFPGGLWGALRGLRFRRSGS